MLKESMSRKRKKKLAELPLNLIESEILPRLLAKSVGRCRCVCKQWKSLLSTPMFVKENLQNCVSNINNYKALLLHDGTFRKLNRRRCNANSYPPKAKFVIGSIDGLVCFASDTNIAFWNPLTGAYKKLSSNHYHNLIPAYLDSHYNAFGFYIDSSNDYKILDLTMGGSVGAYIYSHRLDSWRKIVFPMEFTSRHICFWSEATFCGHSVFFTAKSTIDRSNIIICFDVNSETFRKIEFPHVQVPAIDLCGSLVVLNRCIHLCVSDYVFGKNYTSFNHGYLWRMEGDGDGDGWVKVASLSDPLNSIREFRRQPVCTTSIGNWLAVLEEGNKSFKKMNTEEFTKQCGYFCSPSWEFRSRQVIYAETLVSP